MKVTSNSHLLASLTSLVDKDGRQQSVQPVQRQAQGGNPFGTPETERDVNIRKNREALRQTQDDIRRKSLGEVRKKRATEKSAAFQTDQNGAPVNLNHRESFTAHEKPAFTRLGQVVDIRV